MISENWGDLIKTTITRPHEAARRVLALNLPREALWTAIFLVAVLNTILRSLINIAVPQEMFPGFNTPGVYFVFAAGSLVIAIIALFWAGRALGGRGEMTDIMAVIVWLQVLRLMVQVVSVLLLLSLPALAGVLMIAASLIGIWIMAHFVNEAHRLDSLGRAFGVLIAAFLAMVLGVSALLSVVGIGFIV